jgi:minor curlin subunit
VSFAQGTAVDNDYNQNSSFLLFSKENLHLASNTIKNQEDLLGSKNLQRDVMIQQIGSFNYVNANLKAKDINVSLVQNGIDNEIFMDKNANSIVQKIVQEGKSNYIKDFSLYVNYDINMEIIQKGNNQNIQNYGTNSLSKNMKIIQSGNGASVIILNK